MANRHAQVTASTFLQGRLQIRFHGFQSLELQCSVHSSVHTQVDSYFVTFASRQFDTLMAFHIISGIEDITTKQYFVRTLRRLFY